MRRGRILAVLAVLGASWAVSGTSPAPAAANDLFPFSLPAHYIAHYETRLQACRGFRSPPFVTWNSYADVQSGDQWMVYASSGKLCKFARHTALSVPDALPFNAGAGANKSDLIGYALNVGQEGMNDDPISRHHKEVPKGWRCYALPSEWATEAWTAARLSHVPAPDNEDFAGASGTAAGAGYCVPTGSKSNKAGDFVHSAFLAWIPDGSDCKRHFRIHQDPDPANPGEFLPPPSFPDAQLFGSYDEIPC